MGKGLYQTHCSEGAGFNYTNSVPHQSLAAPKAIYTDDWTAGLLPNFTSLVRIANMVQMICCSGHTLKVSLSVKSSPGVISIRIQQLKTRAPYF